ncbi:hypothetical protein V9T40_005207 [Parthenolecanium corni]|uniref:Uncharacterized protein n=1 Tax=Parthenolecanium corni TaxID=536013 RepID=A0AAN9TFI7_9HEMI
MEIKMTLAQEVEKYPDLSSPLPVSFLSPIFLISLLVPPLIELSSDRAPSEQNTNIMPYVAYHSHHLCNEPYYESDKFRGSFSTSGGDTTLDRISSDCQGGEYGGGGEAAYRRECVCAAFGKQVALNGGAASSTSMTTTTSTFDVDDGGDYRIYTEPQIVQTGSPRPPCPRPLASALVAVCTHTRIRVRGAGAPTE